MKSADIAHSLSAREPKPTGGAQGHVRAHASSLLSVSFLTLAWLSMAMLVTGAALSQPASFKPPTEAECLNSPAALGLSRIVEVDTSQGPRFGYQYEENVFLEPGEVVLTFDDGPMRRFTQPILDVLDKHCVKATFFVVGRMAIGDPKMLREIHARGHTVGAHTYSHPNLGRVGRARAEREMELGFSAIRAALGKPIAPFFRFPYLSDPASAQKHLQGRGIGIFGIDVDSKDFQTRSGQRMVQRVLKELDRQGKGIVLFHDIQRSTADGLEQLLVELKKRNFKVVHMVAKADLETLPNYDAIANKMMSSKLAKSPPGDPAMAAGANSVARSTQKGDDLPWKKPESAPDPRPAPPARTPPKKSAYGSEDRWQLRSMGW